MPCPSIEYKLHFVSCRLLSSTGKTPLAHAAISGQTRNGVSALCRAHVKCPIVKYFGSNVLPGNRISTGQRHSIAAGCDLTRIPRRQRAYTPGERFIVDCVSRWNRVSGSTPLSLPLVSWISLGGRRPRWRHSKRRVSMYAPPGYLTDTIETSNIQNWLISFFGVKENARWKCQPFSRAREIAFVSCEWISLCNGICLFIADWYNRYCVFTRAFSRFFFHAD